MDQQNNEAISQQSNKALNQWPKRNPWGKNDKSTSQWISQPVKPSSMVSMNRPINEPMNQWIYQPMNQWINQPMNQCELMKKQRHRQSVDQSIDENQWIHETMDLWISESTNQSTNQPTNESVNLWSMNQWITDSMSQWMNGWTNEWMDWRMGGWMDGWKDRWVKFFPWELLLHWETSSLRHLFSQLLLLLWAST